MRPALHLMERFLFGRWSRWDLAKDALGVVTGLTALQWREMRGFWLKKRQLSGSETSRQAPSERVISLGSTAMTIYEDSSQGNASNIWFQCQHLGLLIRVVQGVLPSPLAQLHWADFSTASTRDEKACNLAVKTHMY